ncbi:MAG: phosphatase PAP2 family protein [Alphaproteobacteria bacterium]
MLLAFVLAAGSTAVAKLIFLGCVEESWFGIRSPSGHTAISLSVYAMLALLVSSQMPYRLKLLPHLIALLLVGGIAVSRVTLGHHSMEEVIIGLTIGICAVIAASMLLFYKRAHVERFNVWSLLLLIVGCALLLHGTRLPAEQFIKHIAAMLKDYIPACG